MLTVVTQVTDTPYVVHVDSPLESVRTRLVDATLDAVREQGLAGVSLRGVARRAGVSHAAPLKHYAGFGDLLTEAAAAGFERLGERVDEAGASLAPGAGSRARLTAAGRAYIELGVEEPDLFALMFRFDLLNASNRRYQTASRSVYQQFLRYVRAVQDDGWYADAPTEVVNATVWSLVHGLATLWAGGALAASLTGIASLDEVVDRSLAMVLGPRPEPT
jgi:AcrR family transcriptional regulator